MTLTLISFLKSKQKYHTTTINTSLDSQTALRRSTTTSSYTLNSTKKLHHHISSSSSSMMGRPLIPGLPDDIARECLTRVPYTDLHTIRSVCKLWQGEVESPFFHHLRKASGLTRPLVALTQSEPVSIPAGGPAQKYAFTPAYRLALFDPEAGWWSYLPPLPGRWSTGLPLFCQIAGSTRELVVVGGWNPETWVATDEVFVYDFLSATWRAGARLPGPRRSFFACASSDVDRMVFVAGGHDEEKNALRSGWAYDVARDMWLPMPDMSRERDEAKGVFHGGKFHVIGGYSTEMQGRFGKCSEAFDFATCEWAPVGEDTLESGTCPRTCIVAGDGRIYRCRAGKVAVQEGKAWRDVAEIRADARVAPQVVGWRGKLVVIGSGSHGGPHVAYVLEGGEGKGYTWTRLEVPEKYSGPIQTTCYLEI